MAKIKDLYVGIFPFRKSIYTERCMAYSESQARMLLCRRIAKKQNVDFWTVFNFFEENPYNINCEVKFDETD